jgi:hypothetical protein
MIHRLKWGGTMQIVSLSRLEGLANNDESYIPHCPELDQEVRQLHGLARSGVIPVDTAERQLNTYLLAAAYASRGMPSPSMARRLILPLTDAPHHDLLPDLGQIIHRVLARDPVPCALSAVVEQCIPCFRHATRVICYTGDSQEPLLSLVMGLLLGLYQGSVKKPGFSVRVVLYERMHALLTAPAQDQSEFCRTHEDILVLACMEYVARVLPVHMPVQSQLLTGGDSATAGFFRRIPVLCDELRQWLDDTTPSIAGPAFWPSVRLACAGKVDRVSRLKRCHPPHPPAREHCDPHAIMAQDEAGIEAYWGAPLLVDGTTDEYRLMGLGLGLRGGVLQHIQRELRIYPLPGNLRAMQTQSLQKAARSSGDTVHLQTFRCLACARETGRAMPESRALDKQGVPCQSLVRWTNRVCHARVSCAGQTGRAIDNDKNGPSQVHLHALHAVPQVGARRQAAPGHAGHQADVRDVPAQGPDPDEHGGPRHAVPQAALLSLPVMRVHPGVQGGPGRADLAHDGAGWLDLDLLAPPSPPPVRHEPSQAAVRDLLRAGVGPHGGARGPPDGRDAPLSLLPAPRPSVRHGGQMRQRAPAGGLLKADASAKCVNQLEGC